MGKHNKYIVPVEKEINRIVNQFNNAFDLRLNYEQLYRYIVKTKQKDKYFNHFKKKERSDKLCFSLEELIETGKKYNSMKDFSKNHSSMYEYIKRSKLRAQVLPHIQKNLRYTDDELHKIALKYKTVGELDKANHNVLAYICNRKLQDKCFSHMIPAETRKHTDELIIKTAKKFKSNLDFKKKSPNLYYAAQTRGFLSDLFPDRRTRREKGFWTAAKIKKEASKFKIRVEFCRQRAGAYDAALTLGIVDEVCSHMDHCGSFPELQLREFVLKMNSDAIKKMYRFQGIPGHSYIKGFELDVFVPSLNKAIELDGDYWHSLIGLKKRLKKWPLKSIRKYHEIKNEYFTSTHGIKILHITESEWNNNRKFAEKKIKKFLSSAT